MANWFENNPVKSIIGHTVLIAGVTWAISTFIIDEQRINLYKAQADDSKAIAEQYKAKSEVLEIENGRLREDNRLYLKWLENQPESFPSLKKQINELESKVLSLPSGTDVCANKQKSQIIDIKKVQLYSVRSDTLKIGDSFIDPYTFTVLGVSDIYVDSTAKVTLKLPGKESKDIDKVGTGKSWQFEFKNKSFLVILSRINWTNNSFEVQLKQLN